MMLTEHDLYGWQCRLNRRIRDAFKATEAKGLLTFVDAGQGKTLPSLQSIRDLLDEMQLEQCLIVAPIEICEAVWRQEAKKLESTRDLSFSLIRGTPGERALALAKRADVYLINFEHLKWLKRHLRGKFKRFPLIFIDESSLIKNDKSERFKVLKEIKDANLETVTFVMLTGTPMPKDIRDLWTQAYLVDGGDRLGADPAEFKWKFFKRGRKLAPHVYESVPEDFAFDAIKELLADVTLELSDEDKKKFPVVEVEHYVELPRKVREQYDQLENDMLFEWNDEEYIPKHGGARSILCRQIASGAMYVNRLISEDYNVLHDEKLDVLANLLEQLNRPCIIAYEFRHDLARLKHLLGADCLVLNEADTVDARTAWNAGKVNNLLIHNSSNVFGLNLQGGGHTLVRFSETWSQDKHDQLRARLARNGQKADQVFDHYIRARHTVEDLMKISRTFKGDEQARFRKAIKAYQKLRGIA